MKSIQSNAIRLIIQNKKKRNWKGKNIFIGPRNESFWHSIYEIQMRMWSIFLLNKKKILFLLPSSHQHHHHHHHHNHWKSSSNWIGYVLCCLVWWWWLVYYIITRCSRWNYIFHFEAKREIVTWMNKF